MAGFVIMLVCVDQWCPTKSARHSNLCHFWDRPAAV